jgi:1-deoxy-D-xylulose-5-phosphate reductoisomerase
MQVWGNTIPVRIHPGRAKITSLTATTFDLLYDNYKMNEQSRKAKRIAVLGSTGSIGRQTLDIVKALPDKFEVVGLAAGENLHLLEKQILEFKPRLVFHNNQTTRLKADGFRLASMEEIASHPDVDIVIIATSGKTGLNPALEAIKTKKKIALANKESLVMAGELIREELKKHSASILPIDSEHSAIWQCLNGETLKPTRLILTASGGPFLRFSSSEMAQVTVEQALKHPSWSMGKKVTIDSATLMNKGLEVIEAHWLFEMPYDKIDILVHPQSIIHSMVEFTDSSLKAQLSYPDMRLPIQYALSYPERFPNSSLPRLDWNKVKSLNFEQPNFEVFPCLKLAIEAGKRGGTYPAALCAADEVAVDRFLKNQIRFTDIPNIIEQTLQEHHNEEHPDLETILRADGWARETALKLISGVSQCR